MIACFLAGALSLSLSVAPAAAAPDAVVTVPVEAWEARVAAAAAVEPVPLEAVMGRARWTGTADPETLALAVDATLDVSLSGSTGVARVPLLGPEAVLVGVEVDGRPVAVDQGPQGYVWPTTETGDHTVRVRARVAPSGQRGSVEYDFGVPRTAATSLSLTLPRPGLRPEIARAVRTTVQSTGDRSHVVADLAPTDRIRLLGLKDLEASGTRAAKQYAESAHLVAVDEHRIEIYTVVRYTILYAGARSFEVFVPEGLSIVSADGEGAYTYEVVEADSGTILKGETAYPIRNHYEVSLRLSRDLPQTATRLALPHAVGVEREHGWVGVEAPGRVNLEEVEPDGIVAVDPSALPDELRHASVSPLLYGMRTHGDGAIRIRATPLPEVEVNADRIDRVNATTVVSSSGRAVTEIAVTLRNRLRHALLLDLPPGAEVTRAFLDGDPVVPSRTAKGQIAVPLRRSAPDAPFSVSIVVASPGRSPGLLGATALALPAFDLPTTALSWSVSLPEGWRWSELRAPSDRSAASDRATGSPIPPPPRNPPPPPRRRSRRPPAPPCATTRGTGSPQGKP